MPNPDFSVERHRYGVILRGQPRIDDAAVLEMLRPVADVHALRVTAGGHPAHPLYLPRGLQPVVMQARRVA
jgi:hypothetical protein